MVIFLGLILFETFRPRPTDWTLSFERDDARPHGAQILFEQLPQLFPDATLEAIQYAPYRLLRDPTLQNTTYLLITDAIEFDPALTEVFLEFIARGNTAFLAAHRFEGSLADSLLLDEAIDFGLLAALLTNSPDAEADDELTIQLTNPALQGDAPSFNLAGRIEHAHFTRLDSARTTVLGTNSLGDVNYVQLPYGAGHIYLHALPVAFTNVHVLDTPNEAYAARALSALPVPATLLWDGHHKPLRQALRTPLRYVLQTPGLRGVWYTLLAGLLLFIFAYGRRRQRPIPVIPPPQNASLRFVETVGRLYYQQGDYADLVRKKATYFDHYVRNQLGLPQFDTEPDVTLLISQRSGLPKETIQTLLHTLSTLRNAPSVTEDAAVRLSAQLDAFYEQSRR